MIWNFSANTKVSKFFFGLNKVKLDIFFFYLGNKCTNNINSMFKQMLNDFEMFSLAQQSCL